METAIQNSKEYQLISEYYGEQRAARSQVRLIQHIDEGLKILEQIGASLNAKRAYCLHPLLQGDDALAENWGIFHNFIDNQVIILVMEYRNIANQYLSHRNVSSLEEIALSPLEEVNQMLVADKVQNRKDFDIYHKESHPRSEELSIYFDNWLKRLGIDEMRYKELIRHL